MSQSSSFFIKKNIVHISIFILVVFVFTVASKVTDFNAKEAFQSIPDAFLWIGKNFVPNQQSLKKMPDILMALKETFFLAVATATTASVLALLFSVLGARTTKVNNFMGVFVRMVASFFRNVPDIVWAMILLFSFGQSIMTGFFALFFSNFGTLTRAFTESIDEVGEGSVEGLKSTGASYFQIVSQSVIPQTLPQIITWILYMIETNIRSATLIGVLTATGIGNLFSIYYNRLDYNTASLVVISIVTVVLVLQIISTSLRKVII